MPGGIVVMRNPNQDVRTERPADVTGSAYAEQDRFNLAFDEIAGTFSNSSVQSNRQLNETVGGMQILAGSAAGLAEFDMRTFAETWAEPVLRQVVSLEQRFETDPVILALAGEKAEIAKRFQIDVISDDLLNQDLSVVVNVGIGATNPQQKLDKLGAAMAMTLKLLGPDAAKRLNWEELIPEIFGAAGYSDGKRFFLFEDDPKYAQLVGAIEEMQGVIAKLSNDREAQMAIEKMRLEGRQAEKETDVKGKLVLQHQGDQADLKEIIVKALIERQQQFQEQIGQQIATIRDSVGRGSQAPFVLDSKSGTVKDMGEMQAGWQQTAAMLKDGMAQMFGRIETVLGAFAGQMERMRIEAVAEGTDVRRQLATVAGELAATRAQSAAETAAVQAEQRRIVQTITAPRERRIDNLQRDEKGRLVGADIVDASGAVVSHANLARGRDGRVSAGTLRERPAQPPMT